MNDSKEPIVTDNAPSTCLAGHRHLVDVVRDVVNGHAGEVDTFCLTCHRHVSFYAYGFYQVYREDFFASERDLADMRAQNAARFDSLMVPPLKPGDDVQLKARLVKVPAGQDKATVWPAIETFDTAAARYRRMKRAWIEEVLDVPGYAKKGLDHD